MTRSQKLVHPDTRAPMATWNDSGASIIFDTRPDQIVSRKTMQDSIQREFSGPLTWEISNGVADLGYDHADSQGNDKWLYFYWVGSGTIIASDNAPSTGPTGHGNFICCASAYIAAGAIIAFRQRGQRFDFFEIRTPLSLNNTAAVARTSLDLTNFVPPTATDLIGLSRIIDSTDGNQWYLRFTVRDEDDDAPFLIGCWQAGVGTQGADVAQTIPIITSQTTYYTLILAAGSGTCNAVRFYGAGYYDGAVEA